MLPCYCVIPSKDTLSRSICKWTWYPYSPAATYPFDIRLGAFQGHSNQVVDPIVAHHQLTYDEAMSLGWIFHVTDSSKLRIHSTKSGLKTNVKGSGKGGRDAVHFMYHNDNGQGYIRMAQGTTPPRILQNDQCTSCWIQFLLRTTSSS